MRGDEIKALAKAAYCDDAEFESVWQDGDFRTFCAALLHGAQATKAMPNPPPSMNYLEAEAWKLGWYNGVYGRDPWNAQPTSERRDQMNRDNLEAIEKLHAMPPNPSGIKEHFYWAIHGNWPAILEILKRHYAASSPSISQSNKEKSSD